MSTKYKSTLEELENLKPLTNAPPMKPRVVPMMADNTRVIPLMSDDTRVAPLTNADLDQMPSDFPNFNHM